jgi:hypothetical protein
VLSKWGVILIVINVFNHAEVQVEALEGIPKMENSKFYYDE